MNLFENHIPLEKVKQNEPLKDHTYIQLGGKADILIHPTTKDEIKTIVEIAKNSNCLSLLSAKVQMSSLKTTA